MGKHADSTDSRILRRIQGRKRGWVFTPDSFTDLGTRRAVDLAMMRHRNSGLIRQLAREFARTRPAIAWGGRGATSSQDVAPRPNPWVAPP